VTRRRHRWLTSCAVTCPCGVCGGNEFTGEWVMQQQQQAPQANSYIWS